MTNEEAEVFRNTTLGNAFGIDLIQAPISNDKLASMILRHLRYYSPNELPLFEEFCKKHLPLRAGKGVVGLEFEIEGFKKALPPPYDKIWLSKADGSLRNGGIEFVSHPLEGDAAGLAIAYLYYYLNSLTKSKMDFSWRTSVHVHMNVQDFKMEQLYSLILLYAIFEYMLFDFAGQDRDRSPFCIPLYDTDYLQQIALSAKRNIKPRGNYTKFAWELIDYWEKYSALNFTRLRDLGTAEFRHMPGDASVPRVVNWLNLLLRMRDCAFSGELENLKKEIMTLNTSSHYGIFADAVFGEFLPYDKHDPKLARLLSKGVRMAKMAIAGREAFIEIPAKSQFKASAIYKLFAAKINEPEKQVKKSEIEQHLEGLAIDKKQALKGNKVKLYWNEPPPAPPNWNDLIKPKAPKKAPKKQLIKQANGAFMMVDEIVQDGDLI